MELGLRFFWYLASLFFGLTAALSAHAQSPALPKARPEPIIYRGATLIDGSGGPALPNRAVITRGERIEAVLPDDEVTPAMLAGGKAVELKGRYLLPGLIDSHQHIATPPNR